MKKLIALLLMLVLAFTFVACSKDETAAEKVDTAADLMDKVMENAQENTNGEFNGEFVLEMSGLDELEMFGEMTLAMTGKAKDEKSMQAALNIDSGLGFAIEADMYVNEEKVLLHVPLMDQMLGMGYEYMQLNMSDVTDMYGDEMPTQDAEQIIEVLDRFQEETEYSIYDVLVLEEKMAEEKITINDKKVETTKVSMSISLDDAVDMVYAFLAFVAEDEEAKGLLLADMTQEEIDAMLAEMQDPEMRKELDASLEMIKINQFNVDFYINSDFAVVKTDISADLSMTNEGETLNIKLSGIYEMFNLGDVKEIEMPEVAPDEIMNLQDMMAPDMF